MLVFDCVGIYNLQVTSDEHDVAKHDKRRVGSTTPKRSEVMTFTERLSISLYDLHFPFVI